MFWQWCENGVWEGYPPTLDDAILDPFHPVGPRFKIPFGSRCPSPQKILMFWNQDEFSHVFFFQKPLLRCDDIGERIGRGNNRADPTIFDVAH